MTRTPNTEQELHTLSLPEKLSVVAALFATKKPAAVFEDQQVVDDIIELRQAKKTIEAREKLLAEILKGRKDEILDQMTEPDDRIAFKGLHHPGLLAKRVFQNRIDTEAVKEEMGEDWWEEHCKTINFIQLDVATEEKIAQFAVEE